MGAPRARRDPLALEIARLMRRNLTAMLAGAAWRPACSPLRCPFRQATVN